ncbi:DinB family protein [Amycolatopsis vastitatis]|uniref:Mini-circle protein n=1 Tax=Amycolatopsis vastitatis TaxID=1905142 RepID=A0A229SRR6_9PSEU|nr:DinB family protein [Amycolatopsis vastitatis]OXM61289.1 mini-circle protein [Amycolatopsis vastitatis]
MPATRRRRDTPPPRTGADEKAVLRGFLGYLRDAVAAKAEGVPEPAVRTPGVPSGTSLLGLVRHLTAVERFTFLGEAPAGWPGTFRPRPDETAASVLAGYRAACAEADAVIDACTDLAQPVRRGGPSMRWALVHLIEETGRHAGHADILRELADGSTGR